MLLLLDNLEQVIDCAPELASLLEACPNLNLLVTSRQLLRVRGEVEYAVPALAEEEAIELFGVRAQLEADEAITELCRRLDNLPLAVELAAARTSVLTPQQILERLSQRLDLLKGGRDADPRQQTLRATIEWSYDLLPPQEQRLFARLSVFSGGCTLKAAEDVAEADLDTLQSLVEKNLVRFTNGRYWLLATIREFAADRLLHSSDEAAHLERHATYFTNLVLEANASLSKRQDQEFWWSTLQVDYANIRTTLEHLHHRDRRRLLECATALRVFWRIRGPLAEGRLWLERGLEADDPVPAVRSRALDGLAHIASAQGDLEGAARYVEEALRIARSAGDGLVVSMLLSNLARISAARLELDRALALQYEAVDLARDLDEKVALANALDNLGYIMLVGGDAAGAIPFMEEGLSISREIGDVSGQSTGLLNLGSAQLRLGRLDVARRVFLDAMETAARVGWDEWAAYGLQGVAATIVDSDPRRAAELLGASGRLFDESGIEIEPIERRIREMSLHRVGAMLGDEAEKALASGAVLETDAAVELAKASGEPDSA
jgi:predicted ATPase